MREGCVNRSRARITSICNLARASIPAEPAGGWPYSNPPRIPPGQRSGIRANGKRIRAIFSVVCGQQGQELFQNCHKLNRNLPYKIQHGTSSRKMVPSSLKMMVSSPKMVQNHSRCCKNHLTLSHVGSKLTPGWTERARVDTKMAEVGPSMAVVSTKMASMEPKWVQI